MTRLLAADPAGIAAAADILRGGGLVAFPTETVYGLGADSTDDRAVARIFAAKGRPRFNPLIVHVSDAELAFRLGRSDGSSRALAAAFWPGPLTLVLPAAEDCPVSLLARAGLDTVALRVPVHPVARALLAAAGLPVAAPSANRSGHVSPTTAAHVLDDLAGQIDAVLDGGPCPIGVESTVLDLSGTRPTLLRPGGVTVEAIEAVIGPIALAGRSDGSAPKSPGRLESHYAPSLPLRLDALDVAPDEALLAFGPAPPPAPLAINLSREGDLTEAAARLYAALRSLDAEARKRGLTRIAVMPIPPRGLGLAIADRLHRAAAPRSPRAGRDGG